MLSEKTELQTRKEQIDKTLVVSGWTPICTFFKDIRFRSGTIKEYATANGPADYLLFDNDEALAVVEVIPPPPEGGGVSRSSPHPVPPKADSEDLRSSSREVRPPGELPEALGVPANFVKKEALEMLTKEFTEKREALGL